jgi:hypothetical protein
MTQQRFDCPRCGAPLHASSEQPTAHCHYCAEDVPVPWSVGHERRDGDPPRRSTPPPPANRSGSALPALLLLGAGAGAYYYVQHRGPHDIPVTVSHDSAEDVEWDAANSPPIIAALGGREDFVGAFWTAKKGESRRDHAVYVGLFDGTSHERVWYAGPFGRIAQAKGSTHFAFAQGRVLVTDYRGMLYSFDATSGKEQFAAKLPDRARGICEDGARVWVDVVGDRGVDLDLAKGTYTSSPARPAGCPPAPTAAVCSGHRGRASCDGPERGPKVAGFKPNRVLLDEGDGIVLGTSMAPRPLPMIVGFDQTGGEVRFAINLQSDSVGNALGVASSVAELSGGRLYAQYELKDTKWRLACFDAKTGQRIWDVVVPGSKHGDEARSIALSSSRLYLSHGDWLDIFDVKTGGALGEFGR